MGKEKTNEEKWEKTVNLKTYVKNVRETGENDEQGKTNTTEKAKKEKLQHFGGLWLFSMSFCPLPVSARKPSWAW